MENKNFDNPAEMFFSDVTAPVVPDEQATEKKADIREQLQSEKLTKRVQLTITPTAYAKAKAKALSEGRSFNNYINNLILKDILK